MQPNLSASWLFQRAMSAKQKSNVQPDFINELLHVNFQSMQVKTCIIQKQHILFCLACYCLLFLFLIIYGFYTSEAGGSSA